MENSIIKDMDILRSYSEGKIGWREAVGALDLMHFDELVALMAEKKLPFYEPSPALQTENIRTLGTMFTHSIKQALDNESQ